jgi:hypothetical protein
MVKKRDGFKMLAIQVNKELAESFIADCRERGIMKYKALENAIKMYLEKQRRDHVN